MIRLKQLRKEQKVTQIELAQMLNVKQTTISNWENEITEIDQQSLFTLADYFNVSVDYCWDEIMLRFPKKSRSSIFPTNTRTCSLPLKAVRTI